MRLAWKVPITLIALAAGTDLAAPICHASNEGSVKVFSVQSYQARQIDSGEIAGHFLHVRVNVIKSSSTQAQLNAIRAVSVSLVAALKSDAQTFIQCGIGGYLRQVDHFLPDFSESSQKVGVQISPLFYLPSGVLEGPDVLELRMVLVEDGARWLEPPVSRAPVPWTPDLLSSAGPAKVVLLSVKSKELSDETGTAITRSVQVVRLRLPSGLKRVLRWGKSELHCGSEIAEASRQSESSQEIIDTQLSSSIDALSCPWEIWFPDVGVKLELEVAKPDSAR